VNRAGDGKEQPFRTNECYSRSFISRQLGGGTQNYLPHKDGRVVCGCFTKEKNPLAPEEILPGDRSNGSHDRVRWARQFAQQDHAIPVFIKTKPKSWRYVGMWRVEEQIEKTDNPDAIAEANNRSSRTDVAMILRLAKQR